MSSKEASSAPPAAAAAGAVKPDASEADFLLFGSRPSHLFDDMRITLDTLLTEEVASLPLLPRTLSSSQRQQQREQQQSEEPLTGEQKLIAKLRKAYKKNLDLAEAYCSRNIFTVQYYNKTKRRKILEHVLREEDDKNDGNNNNEEGGQDNNNVLWKAFSPLPAITFEPPTGEIPSAEEMNGKNKQILQTRQQIQFDKQRRVQLSRQLDRLTKAAQQLKELRGALEKALETKKKKTGGQQAEGESNNNNNNTLAMKELQELVVKAVEGHEELKVWNARAEEVIQLMDQIKDEREEGGGGLLGGSSRNTNGSLKRVALREEDERERKRMLSEMSGVETASSHGTKEEIASLLNKIRS
jgi:hypothetical protein